MAHIIADRVKETSTTTGTGALTLAGAMTGFKTFASRCAVGDTVYYGIQSVDGTGSPTADWEVGLGTYSGANTLTRTTPIASSNADAAVSFAAGTKQVFITMPARQMGWIRERVTSARTYYVRTDGSDSNDGLANTAGGAFLTIQKAVDVACGTLEVVAGITVTIQIGDGTYTAGVIIGSFTGEGTLTIQGNSGTPSNVLVSTTSADAFRINTVRNLPTIKDLKVQTTTVGFGIGVYDGAIAQFGNIVFGACASGHIAVGTFARLGVTSNYSVTAGAPYHLYLYSYGRFYCSSKTITISGSPTVTTWLTETGLSYANLAGNTYSGAVTAGTKYSVTQNSISDSAGTLPGASVGSTATGGQYL